MQFPVVNLPKADFSTSLLEIPEPPTNLNFRGHLPPPELNLLAVVGSRKYTSYGKQATTELINGLRGYPIGIVSGLALGIDSLAHEAALQNDLYTLAVPGGGLADDSLYPRTHKALAHRILESGGGLLSEYEPSFKAAKWSFTKRNRIVAGLCQATLLVEGAEKSGTLVTARMTVDYNRELLVVPGSIFSTTSAGTNQFLKLGATPVTCAEDILEALRIETKVETKIQPELGLSPEELMVMETLSEPTHKDELIRKIALPTPAVSQLLMMMEIKGLIISDHNIYQRPIK